MIFNEIIRRVNRRKPQGQQEINPGFSADNNAFVLKVLSVIFQQTDTKVNEIQKDFQNRLGYLVNKLNRKILSKDIKYLDGGDLEFYLRNRNTIQKELNHVNYELEKLQISNIQSFVAFKTKIQIRNSPSQQKNSENQDSSSSPIQPTIIKNYTQRDDIQFQYKIKKESTSKKQIYSSSSRSINLRNSQQQIKFNYSEEEEIQLQNIHQKIKENSRVWQKDEFSSSRGQKIKKEQKFLQKKFWQDQESSIEIIEI